MSRGWWGPWRAAGWVLLLLAALAVVVWRQSVGVALEREIRALEAEHAGVETRAVETTREIQRLGSRSRVVSYAREQLGMHLPTDEEVVLLRIEPAPGPGEEGR